MKGIYWILLIYGLCAFPSCGRPKVIEIDYSDKKCVFRDDYCTSTVKKIVDGKATEFGAPQGVNDANGQFNEILDQWCDKNIIGKPLKSRNYAPDSDGVSLEELCKNTKAENCLAAETSMPAKNKSTLQKNTARFCKLVNK